jgi:hypothetical protein
VAQNDVSPWSAIDGRTTRHPGYAVRQRIRKRTEGFGWMKGSAGLMFRAPVGKFARRTFATCVAGIPRAAPLLRPVDSAAGDQRDRSGHPAIASGRAPAQNPTWSGCRPIVDFRPSGARFVGKKMLKTLAFSFGLTALLLAGCNPSPPQPKPTATAPRMDYLAAINKLTQQQRDATFYRAIEDAGFTCDSVSASVPQVAMQGHPAWEARCGDGRHWILVLLDDGVIQVFKAAPANAAPTGPGANKM